MFDRQTIQGAWFATAAYTFWGFAPIYFKWLGDISPFEIVSQRVIWSVPLLLVILVYMGDLDALHLPRKDWWKVTMSAGLLSVNWLTFIFAVTHNNIVAASLGYFINPLVNVFLGMVFLRERLRPLQWVAISIAAIGISLQLIYYGQVPWISLILAFSFGFYGLTRKSLGLHSVGGLALETIIIAPVALVYLGWLASQGTLQFGHVDLLTDFLLVMAGFVTSFPLLCFAAAVKRLSLTAAGMFQYIGPTLSLLVAIIIYNEPFGADRIATFSCIWIALVVFTGETLYHHRRLSRQLNPRAI